VRVLTFVCSWVLLAGPVLAQTAPTEISGAARLGKADQASEYWDVTAAFDSGHRLFARFSITNEGPGDRTAYALGQIVFPDGRVVAFKNGRLEGRWRLSEDRLRIQIGSSVLDLHGPIPHFEVDKNKKGVKLFLDFEPLTESARRWLDAPPGLHLDLLALGAPIRGTVWVRELMGDAAPISVVGRVSLTHAWTDESEPGLVRRRVESHVLSAAEGQPQAYSLEVLRTQGSARSWMVVRRADGSWHETGHFEISESGTWPATEERYPIPMIFEIRGEHLQGRIGFGRRILEHNPLDVAPAPLRWLLSFRTKPKNVWLESTLELEWVSAAASFAISGPGLTSFYFLNPMRDR
jgi:hypothetical protein